MKKKKELQDELSDSVITEKLVDLMSHQLFEESKHLVAYYENKVKLYSRLKASEEEMEPLKIFKRAHKKWQDKMDMYDTELKEAEEHLLVELDSLSELTEAITGTGTDKKKESKKKKPA